MNTNKKLTKAPIMAYLLMLIFNFLVFSLILNLYRFRHLSLRIMLIAMLVFLLVLLLINFLYLLIYSKGRKRGTGVFVTILLLVNFSLAIPSYLLFKGDLAFDEMINQKKTEESEYLLLSLTEESLDDLEGKKVAMIGDEDLEEDLKKSLIRYSRNYELKRYKNYPELFSAIKEENIDFYLLPKDYRRILKEDALVNSLSKKQPLLILNHKIEQDFNQVNVLREPFTVLLLGNNEGLSDSIILASFNPLDLKVTLTSLARDSYVPIACSPYGAKDKLNHSRAYSRQCLVDTVEDFLDVEVDFYFETDFYALVKMVDALGGLEIESPVAFAGSLPLEGNEEEVEAVHVPQGKNLLDGKQVITFARERHHMPNGDFDRQKNQQYVIKALAQKALETRNINTMLSLLDVAKDNVELNVPLSSVNSLLGYALNQMQVSPVKGIDTFRIVQNQVAGSTPTINGMSVVEPYEEDVRFTHELIHENLSSSSEIKGLNFFDFSYMDPYNLSFFNADMAGGSTAIDSYQTIDLPDFTKYQNQSEVISWAYAHNLEVVIHETEQESYQKILRQYPLPGVYLYPFEQVHVYLSKDSEKLVQVPDFSKKSLWNETTIQKWAKEHEIELHIYYEDQERYPGSFIRQSILPGTDVDRVSGMSITVQE